METCVYAGAKGVAEVLMSSIPDRLSSSLKLFFSRSKRLLNLLTAARTGLDLFDRNLAETLLNVVSTAQRSSNSRLLEKIKKKQVTKESSI